jgi:hypothetical protein
MKRFRSSQVSAICGAKARRLTALALCGIAAMMAGCSAHVSVGSGETTAVRSDEISYAEQYMSHQFPDLPPTQSVDCPSDVPLKVGSTYECQATLTDGQVVTIPFRLTSVNGDNGVAHANVALVIEALAVDIIYKAAPSPPTSVDCPTDVPATQNKTFECQVTLTNGTAQTVTLKVTSATSRGQDVNIASVHKA